MKKFLLAVSAILVCATVSAQDIGDKYVGASLIVSYGNERTESFDGTNTHRAQWEPLTTMVGAGAEFAFFTDDDFRVALGLGLTYSLTPKEKVVLDWHMVKTMGAQINLNIARYYRLADRLYLTPEIGFIYEAGPYREDKNGDDDFEYTTYYGGWVAYLSPLMLEFRVNPKIAVGMGIGSVSYTSAWVKVRESDERTGKNQLRFDMNNASCQVRFYY